MEGKFYTVNEFAEIVKMCPQTVRRAIKACRIMAFRPGTGIKSPYRIHESEILRIMNASYQEIIEEIRK